MERVAPAVKDEDFLYEEQTLLSCSRRERAKFSFHRWFAKCESFLSTNAFTAVCMTSYAFVSVLLFLSGAREEYLHTKMPVMRWFISIARGFGYVLNLNCGLVILLTSRLALTALRETPLALFLPLDKSFPSFHIIVGYISVISVFGHGIFHMVWIINWNFWQTGLWGINMCVGTGFALFGILLLMVIPSVQHVRRPYFEAFYFIHNVGAFLFFTLLIFHGVYRGVPYTYKWIVGPILVYSIDRSLRRMKVVNSTIHLSENNSILKGANVLQLILPKQFEYRAGQYAGMVNEHGFFNTFVDAYPCIHRGAGVF